MTKHMSGKMIVEAARQWIGTPYQHQASLKHKGCDCLGLIRGIWREIIGAEPQQTPEYTADWGEVGKCEGILDAAERHFNGIKMTDAKPGDLLVFRWRHGTIAKHVGILSDTNQFIHAYERSGVIESPLVLAWRTKIAGCFRFPGVE